MGNVTLQGLDRDFELPDWGKARVLGLHYLEAVQSLLWCECAISYILYLHESLIGGLATVTKAEMPTAYGENR